jgi:type I restriction enzyme S subunit
MDVKPGYKQTEVGLIPEDWDLASLSSILKEPMQNGLFFKPSLKGSGVKLINVGDLYTRVPIDSGALELFAATNDEREKFKVDDGDLFFTRSSVVASGIAHCNIYRSLKPESVVFDSHVIRIRPDARKVVPSFLFRFCLASLARRYLVSHAKTATMTTIDQGVLQKCPILLPPYDEQEAIADALINVDALIESLEHLLVKKRRLKLGGMQELLTGKKRLPGFSGEWEIQSIERLEKAKLVKLSRGKVISKRDIERVPGDCPIYSSSVTNDGLFGYYGEFMFDEEMITWSIDGGGHFFYRPKHRFSVTNVCGFMRVDSSQISYRFLAAQLHLLHSRKSFDYLIKAHPSVIRKAYDVPLPHLDEQVAIAAVLADMDAEITALEANLTKARQLKQGMTQELLTGRTRLI